MKQIKNSLAILTLLACFFVFSGPVFGQYYSQTESKPSLVIDKMVRPINDEKFYDNIDSSQKIFSQDEQVEFKIIVKNTGNTEITNIKVADRLPKYLSLVFFPGEFNKSLNQIDFSVDKLGAGESKEYLIRSKLVNLPASTFCGQKLKLTNQSVATATKVSDSDNSSFYVSQTCIPDTGSSDILMKTLLVLTSVLAGLGVRKYARGY
ncbi:hypothetical protein KBC75_02720 [Candidatus Shapirobacteria bacterium]|nr:hypothetical protein [Candidatus Shapirobacteria bacterium]